MINFFAFAQQQTAVGKIDLADGPGVLSHPLIIQIHAAIGNQSAALAVALN